MLAARDQENLVHGHQQAAASKSLNQNIRGTLPKTPGNKYPKTPLKVNLNDENEHTGFGVGRSVLGTKGKGLENLVLGGKNGTAFDKNAFITPMGPRNRAPLGMKTTNAKTKALQTPAATLVEKDLIKTQTKPTSARRPKPKAAHTETVKLNIHVDDNNPLEEREAEYCPPKPTPLPYESDVFPDGCLDYDILKGSYMMRGWQSYYHNPVDENGVSLKEKQFEEECAKAHRHAEERILKQVEEQEWTIGDVPETFEHFNVEGAEDGRKKVNKVNMSSGASNKGPPTIALRQAASALSVAPKAPLAAPRTTNTAATASKKAPSFLDRGKKASASVQTNPSAMRHTAAAAASRSTIGYTKGRSASNVLKMRTEGLTRSTSNVSGGSDMTVTPTLYAQKQTLEAGDNDWRRLLGLFDTDDDDLEPGLRGVLPDCLRKDEDADAEFIMTLSGI